MIWMDVDAALSEVPVNVCPLTDDSDFKSVEELVAYNATGMALYWHFVTTGGATSVTAVTPTSGGAHDWNHQDHGMYTLEIPASAGTINNDTEGFGYFTGSADGVLPWRGPTIGFRAAAINNALIDGGDLLDVNVTEVDGTAQRATDLAEIAQYLIANSAEPITNYVADESLLAKMLAQDGDISAYDDTTDSLEALSVLQATAAKMLAYVQLLARSDAAIETDNSTELGEINTDEGSGAGNYSSQTDSTEAIRDRGDAAWVTATSTTVSDKTGFSLVSTGLDAVTAWTTDITGTFTGNLTGSVDSVTNAVGSVTGAVGSVAGNVDGNVSGSVASVASGGLTAASFAADSLAAASFATGALTADAFAADALVAATFATGAFTADAFAADALVAATFATGAFSADAFAADALVAATFATGALTADAFAATALDSGAISDAVIADAVWNALIASYGTAGTYGEWVESMTPATGATEVTVTVYKPGGSLPLDGVHVWFTTDAAGANVSYDGYTNASGQKVFQMDAGSYYLWKEKAGYSFTNPESAGVS